MQTLEDKCLKTEAPSISAPTARRDYGFIFKSKLIFWGKIAVAILTLWFLFKVVKPGNLIEIFTTSNWQFLAGAALIIIPNVLVQVLKWHYILRLANPAVSFSTAFKSMIVGYPLGFVTPGRLGEIGRAFYVNEISQGKTLKLFILDKATNLIVTVLLGLAGVLLLIHSLVSPSLKALLWTAFFVMIGVLLSLIFLKPLSNLIGRLTKLHHFNRRNSVRLIFFSVLFYGIFLIQFDMLILSFSDFDLFMVSESAASVFLVKTLLPVSFGDLGIREGAALFFFGKIGISPAAAMNASLLLFVFNLCIPSLVGLPILLKTKKNL